MRYGIGKTLALVAALALGSAVSAQAQVMKDEKSGVAYVSGGVGEEELAELKKQEPDYDLKLYFTAGKGEFLASVPVTIEDAKGGRVLETITQGPILLAKLKPGKYKVSVHRGQQCITRSVAVDGKTLRVSQFVLGAD